MSLADPKPAPRVRNADAFKEFHATNPRCLCCQWAHAHAHHVLARSQGGDDMRGNLAPLCGRCHLALHGSPYWDSGTARRITPELVKERLAAYVRGSERHSEYLRGKLGSFAAEAFVQKLEQS